MKSQCSNVFSTALVHVCPFCGVKFSSRNTLDAHVVYYCSKKPLPLATFDENLRDRASIDKDNVSGSDTAGEFDGSSITIF